MVRLPVDDGRGYVVIAEHRSPPGNLQICGDDQATLFMPVT